MHEDTEVVLAAADRAWRLHGFESTDALFGVSGKALGKAISTG